MKNILSWLSRVFLFDQQPREREHKVQPPKSIRSDQTELWIWNYLENLELRFFQVNDLAASTTCQVDVPDLIEPPALGLSQYGQKVALHFRDPEIANCCARNFQFLLQRPRVKVYC